MSKSYPFNLFSTANLLRTDCEDHDPATIHLDGQPNLDNVALLHIASSQAATDNYDQAIETLNQLSLESGAHSYYIGIFKKAEYLLLTQQHDESLSALPLIPAHHPLFYRAQRMMGDILVTKQEWKQALSHFKKIPSNHDTYTDSKVAMTICYCKLKQFSEAKECIDSLPEDNPDIDYFRLEAAQVSSEFNAMFRHSIDILNKISNDFADYLDAMALKGEILYKLKEYKEAVQCLEIIPNTHDDFDKSQIMLSLIHSEDPSRITEAIACLNHISEDSNYFIRSQRVLAELYHLDHQNLLAVDVLDTCIEEYKKIKSYDSLEICYISQLTLLEEIGLNHSEQAHNIHIKVAFLYLHLTNKNTLSTFSNAIKQHCTLIPQDSEFHGTALFLIGLCHYYAGEFYSCIAHLRQIKTSSAFYPWSIDGIIQSCELLLMGPMKNEQDREPLTILQNASILINIKNSRDHTQADDPRPTKRSRIF